MTPKPPQPSFAQVLERPLIDLYETAMLHGEAQANSVGVTLSQRETAILVALNEAMAAHQDSVREAVYGFHEYVIGKDIIQNEADQAFNYARLHRALDAYIEGLRAGLEIL